jgi:endonuclease III
VRLVIWRLFEMCPTPEAAASADQTAIRDLIKPLGLFNKRAAAVQRFSREYLDKQVGRHLESERCCPDAGAWSVCVLHHV